MKLFTAKENSCEKELHEAVAKMKEQIKDHGDQFTFVLSIDNAGWFAKCKEFDGIIAGGANKNPSEKEIMQSLIDAVKTAFHIPISKLEIECKNELSLPKIQFVREFEFA